MNNHISWAIAAFVVGMLAGYMSHNYQVNLAYLKVENLASRQMITSDGDCIMGRHRWPARDGWCYMGDAPQAALN